MFSSILYLWLLNAHVEAPVCGSIILVSITRAKPGGYIIMSVDNIYWVRFKDWLFLIKVALLGGAFVFLIRLPQSDIKSLISALFGVLWGLGSLGVMLSHGVCTSSIKWRFKSLI